MTQLFKRNRILGHAAVFLLSIAVLAIAAHLGSLFLPNINRDFSTFAIVIPVLTLISLLILFGYTRPYIEVIFIFVLGVLWLAMASWSMDIIGHVQCSELGGQQTTTNTGSISTKSYCYEMKIIEAFSWIIFALLAIFFWILVALTNRAIVLGRYMAWREPIVDLPWFGQFPGMPEDHSAYGGHSPYMPGSPMGYPMQPGMMQPGMGYSQAANGGGYVVSQAPGHSVVIEPGSRGRGPTVRQVPGMPM